MESRITSSFQALYVALPNGNDIEVRFPGHAYTPMHLAAGQSVRLSLRKEGLVILPAAQELVERR